MTTLSEFRTAMDNGYIRCTVGGRMGWFQARWVKDSQHLVGSRGREMPDGRWVVPVQAGPSDHVWRLSRGLGGRRWFISDTDQPDAVYRKRLDTPPAT